MNKMLLTPLHSENISIEPIVGKSGDLLVGTPEGSAKVPVTVAAIEGEQIIVETALCDFDGTFPLIGDLELLIEGTGPIALDGCEFRPGEPDSPLFFAAENASAGAESNSASTSLELVLADIAWESNYSVGSGLDALTNAVCNQAVEITGERRQRPTEVKTNATIINTVEEYAKAFEIAVDGHYNTGMVDIKGSMSYMSDVKTSKTSLSIVLEHSVEETIYDSEDGRGTLKYSLMTNAKVALADNNKFRSLYGDYFFADVKNGSKFIAVYNCTTTSEENIQSFKAALSAESDLYGASMSTSFKTAAKNYNVTTNVKLYYVGCNGSPVHTQTSDVMDIGKAIQWFTTHLSPVPVRAKLMHYSSIEPSVPKTVPVAPAKFISIWMMFSKLWRVVARARNCPGNYTGDAVAQAEALRKEIVAHQQSYITRPELIGQFCQKIDALNTFISSIETRLGLYKQLKAASEPDTGEDNMIKADYGAYNWEYGVINYPGARADSYNIKQDSGAFKFRHGDANFNDTTRTVVGYVVHSNWHDDTGGKWYLNKKGLNTHSASVHVKSYLHRGYNWTITVYSVPNSEINFD